MESTATAAHATRAAFRSAPIASARGAAGGLSFEMQRFSDGIRVVVAMLCTVLLFGAQQTPGPLALSLLIAYDLWAGALLWGRARALPMGPALLHFWLDAAWSCAMLFVTAGSSSMLVLTLVHPTVLVSVGYGARQGVLLAVAAAVAIGLCVCEGPRGAGHQYIAHTLPALAVLALVPAAALLTRSMGVLHQHRQLMQRIDAEFDPRRGLAATAAMLVHVLRRETGAPFAALVLNGPDGAACWLGDATAHADTHADANEVHRLGPQHRLDLAGLLSGLPDQPLTCRPVSPLLARLVPAVPGRAWHTRISLRGGGPLAAAVAERCEQLAEALALRSLVVVPLLRDGRCHGHLLLGAPVGELRDESIDALCQSAPELMRLIETATLVDRLQDETAAHERARIGRDLHDSAIQPYLGLKFAVESIAVRARPDDPLRADLDALREFVNAEVDQLRALIVGMRAGQPHGDNSLVPAVRRQSRRFAQMFGIEVQLNAPAELPTSRVLAGALFHMVNEALANVRRHTPARRVWLTLDADVPGALQLRVRDNAGSVRGWPMPPFRPRSLSERAAELGGTLVVTCPDGLNTELLIHIPLQADAGSLTPRAAADFA